MAWLYDSHVHLSDPEYAPYAEELLAGMREARIRACCVSTDAASSEATLRLASQSDLVLPFVGVHPERAEEGAGAVEGIIRENPGIAGIGEIGLDPAYAPGDAEAKRQRDVFGRMLEASERLGLPVSIHSRGSLDEILDILTSYGGRALLHWFDGNKKQLRRAMEMKLYVSYGPVSIYANDKRALMSRTDESRILVETDGPVRFSRCFGGVPAQPCHVPSVALCVSQVLGREYDETVSMLGRNTESYLHGDR